MYYRRVRDGQMVPASEALEANGVLKDGFAANFSHGQRFAQPGDYISFDMAFMDSARPPVASPLSDNDRASVVARAEMMHRTNNAYLGDRAPAFTDAMADLAVRKVESDVSRLQANDAAFAADAARVRGEAEAARAQMIDNIRNGWRN